MMRQRLNSAVYGAQRSSIRQFSALARETPGCIALTLGEPDFDTPAPISAQVAPALQRGETHYIANSGCMPLREDIAAFQNRRFQTDYEPREVLVTAGATEALFTALFGILNPGDEVIVPTPAFLLYQEIVGLCRGVCVPMDTEGDGYQITAENLAVHLTPRTKAVILNSPNNPTGCVYRQESLQAIYQALREREIFLISDDVYDQLLYVPDCPSLTRYPQLREKLLLVQSFSKPYAMTGWRMGWLLADASVMERLELVHQYLLVSTPAPFQEACRAALRYDPSPMVETYRRRRDYVLSRLEDMGLPFVRPEGAFYVFPDIRRFGLSSADFCTRLIRQAGLALTPGACFGGEGHVRISYCCGDAQLQQGLDRLEGFIRTLK